MPRSRSLDKDDLYLWLVHGGFGPVETEFRFHETRKWRADFALLAQRPAVLIEFDGLMHHGSNQGHASISGILRDSEKINAATAMGYRVFRANAKSLNDGSFFTLLESVLESVGKDRLTTAAPLRGEMQTLEGD